MNQVIREEKIKCSKNMGRDVTERSASIHGLSRHHDLKIVCISRSLIHVSWIL